MLPMSLFYAIQILILIKAHSQCCPLHECCFTHTLSTSFLDSQSTSVCACVILFPDGLISRSLSYVPFQTEPPGGSFIACWFIVFF
jgi:hypothetical protein